MNTCDKCGARGPKVTVGDGCPECGQLVGYPVPGVNSGAAEIAAYEVEATDEKLALALQAVANRNFNTLLQRKRRAEAAAGYKAPAKEPDPDEPDQPELDPTGPAPDPVEDQQPTEGDDAQP